MIKSYKYNPLLSHRQWADRLFVKGELSVTSHINFPAIFESPLEKGVPRRLAGGGLSFCGFSGESFNNFSIQLSSLQPPSATADTHFVKGEFAVLFQQIENVIKRQFQEQYFD